MVNHQHCILYHIVVVAQPCQSHYPCAIGQFPRYTFGKQMVSLSLRIFTIYNIFAMRFLQRSIEVQQLTPIDHTSNTDDEYSVHPCLCDDDGSRKTHLNPYHIQGTNYRNQLKYVWSHTAIDSYQYPFSTPVSYTHLTLDE